MDEAAGAQQPSLAFPVVGIGASAGGVMALQALFRAIPAKPDLAFVVVQHMTPEPPNRLVTLLQSWTALPVSEASDGAKLERNVVFVAPPGRALLLRDGVFATQPLDRAELRAGIDTIDRFFESLATDYANRAIAVVLSGTGSDGAAGAFRVKQEGGMVLVQAPATAMHDSMPRAAIATGAADHILPLGALAEELAATAAADYVRSSSAASSAIADTKALESILDLIRTKAGFDLAGYRTPPLLWRIQRRMDFRNLRTLVDYDAMVHEDPAELDALIRAIPIHVTDFFRDASEWERLERDIVPRLFRDAGSAPVRAWTAACATGEEAYSLAMLMAEHAATLQHGSPDFQLFATDAASEIVTWAGRGTFRTDAVSVLSSERRERFFDAVAGGYRIKRELREKMVFAPHNILSDPPFTGLDVVTCRNLLIYLEPDAVERVVRLLHWALRIGGYLLLGKGEGLSLTLAGFEKLAAGTQIYRKVAEASAFDLQFPNRPSRSATARAVRSAVEAHAHEAAMAMQDLPGVLVDEDFEIVRVYGDIAPFLRFKTGAPTLNILGLLTPSARAAVERVGKNALRHERTVTVGLPPEDGSGEPSLDVRVTPLHAPRGGSRLLLAFIRRLRAGDGSNPLLLWPEASPDEAQDWGEALRLSHQELQASREELQALNEELRASNEQLVVANEQLKNKIQELETQSNVLSSGAVMTLFIDQDLQVRWFTPAMKELFPLRLGDAGRPITDIAQRFDDANFIRDVRTVMERNEPREAEVRNVEAKWFLRRIRPYQSGTDTTAGVAVTFTDISERKRAEMQLGRLLEMRAVGVVFFDLVGGITGANDAFLDMIGFSREDLEAGQIRYEKLTPPEWRWRDEETIAQLRETGEGGPGEKEYFRKDGTRIWIYCTSKMLPDGNAVEFVLDITARKNSEAALRQSEERLAKILDTDAIGVLFFDREGRLLDANAMFSEMMGWTRQDIESGMMHWRLMTPPEWIAVSEEQMERLAKTGRIGPYEKDYLKKDGSRSRMLFTGRDLGDGTVVEIVVDIGARKAVANAAEALAE